MSYPTIEQIEAAGLVELVRWNRTLPSPSDADRPKLERIIERMREEREKNPGGYVAASKAVGRMVMTGSLRWTSVQVEDDVIEAALAEMADEQCTFNEAVRAILVERGALKPLDTDEL